MILLLFPSTVGAQPRHVTFQENNGQMGSHAWTSQCLPQAGVVHLRVAHAEAGRHHVKGMPYHRLCRAHRFMPRQPPCHTQASACWTRGLVARGISDGRVEAAHTTTHSWAKWLPVLLFCGLSLGSGNAGRFHKRVCVAEAAHQYRHL